MALMEYREANQVLWRGARPAHNGTQIYGQGSVNGVGNAIVYTCDAVLTTFITYASISTREGVAAAGSSDLAAWTAVPALWRYIFIHFIDVVGNENSAATFDSPLEIPPNYTIRVKSNNAEIDVSGIIWGWEE